MMSVPHRYILFVMGALMMTTASGCFLFGSSTEEEESLAQAIAESAALREGQLAVEEALFRADMAIEEERLDTAVIEFNRAIRADSTQVGIYFELAQLHKQLSAQYREDGNIEAALQENARGLRVLENLMNYQKMNPEVAGNSDMSETPMDDGMPADETPMDDMPAGDMEEAGSEEAPPGGEASEAASEEEPGR